VAVLVPPRPAESGDLRDRSEAERLREQEALIEEARRRARRRRQRYAAIVLLGVTVAVVAGFVRASALTRGTYRARRPRSDRARRLLRTARSRSPTIWDGCRSSLRTALGHR
jgi:hypothetical protein